MVKLTIIKELEFPFFFFFFADIPRVSFTTTNTIGMIWSDTLFEGGEERPRFYSCQCREITAEPTSIWKAELLILDDDEQKTFECTLSDLKPDTVYKVQVVAVFSDNSAKISKNIEVTTLREGS